MTVRERIRGLLLIVLLLLVAKAGQHTYGWYAHREERSQLAVMRERVTDAGAEVVRSEARTDTLGIAIEEADAELEAMRRAVDRYGSYARDGALGAHLYDAYRADLDAYNVLVKERNALIAEWNTLLDHNREAVDRYNLLADSIRTIAASIGDPYYPVPLPVEAAIEQGVLR